MATVSTVNGWKVLPKIPLMRTVLTSVAASPNTKTWPATRSQIG